MPMDAGNAACTTGLSLAIFAQVAGSGDPSLGANPQALTSLKALSHAIANAVVVHIANNATVLVTGVAAGAATAPGTIT